MKKRNIYIIVFLIFIPACGKKIEKRYYETGQLKEERTYKHRNDTTDYFIVSYYLNGQIRSKGQITKGVKIGNWQEFYADGTIKWIGTYHNGQRTVHLPSLKPEIVFDDTVLKAGKKTYLKVRLDGIHPEDMAVGCNNGIIKVSDKKEIFDYMVIPKHQGSIKFFFFLKQAGKMISIGIDSLYVLE